MWGESLFALIQTLAFLNSFLVFRIDLPSASIFVSFLVCLKTMLKYLLRLSLYLGKADCLMVSPLWLVLWTVVQGAVASGFGVGSPVVGVICFHGKLFSELY